jgi:hypothetical protein
MRKIIVPLILLSFFACSTPSKKPQEAENEIDAARQFIRASLDGRFDLARDFLLNDSLNNNYLDLVQRSYQKVSPADRESYKGATIIIHNASTINDSTSILIFSNSFKNEQDTLRVIKIENKWWVDLKYLFGHGRIESTEATAPAPPSTEKP